MGGVIGRTGTYERTPEMLANYSRAARNRNYTKSGRKKLSNRYYRLLEEGRHPCLGKHWKQSPEAIANRIKSYKKRPGGHTGHKHSEDTKARISAIKKSQFKTNPELLKYAIRGGTLSRIAQDKNKEPSSIEKIVYAYLEKKKIKFKKQKSIGNGLYILDAYIPSINLAIEIDGEYWHSLPRAIKGDARKDKFIKRIGLGLVRLPEACVNNGSFKKVLKIILKGENYGFV